MTLIYKAFYSYYLASRKYRSKEDAYRQTRTLIVMTIIFGGIFIFNIFNILLIEFLGVKLFFPDGHEVSMVKKFFLAVLVLFPMFKIFDLIIIKYWGFDKDQEKSLKIECNYNRYYVVLINVLNFSSLLGMILIVELYYFNKKFEDFRTFFLVSLIFSIIMTVKNYYQSKIK